MTGPRLEPTRDVYPMHVEVVQLPNGGHQVAMLVNGETFVMRPSAAAQLAEMLTRRSGECRLANLKHFLAEEEKPTP